MRVRVRYYARYLCSVLKQSLPKENIVGAEIGVWRGNTSFGLLEAFPKLTLYMVDPWENAPPNPSLADQEENAPEAHQQALSNTEFASDRRIILFDVSENAAHKVSDDSLDFVFIDANHMYPSIYADLRLWFPKVRKGGVFSGHDYDKRWGVKPAVDEFSLEHGYTPTIHSRTWWFVK